MTLFMIAQVRILRLCSVGKRNAVSYCRPRGLARAPLGFTLPLMFLASNPGAGARGHARPGHGHGYGLRCSTFEFVSIS
jgi:hypothetical protein